ncbi:MAG: DNA-directed RNA polymerase subunit beta [Kiritimatiellaeota bacterium]|nr:DNA-directed RNA polymerase subunit beta [Kiritimatiellota bacterium]
MAEKDVSDKRKKFGKLKPVITPPNLIDIQVQAYQDFLQLGVPGAQRKAQGLQAIFKEIFPVTSTDGHYVLDFVKYELGVPKMGPNEALYEIGTYAAPLNVTFRLKEGEAVKEEDVYMGEMPLMTQDGAFVVNGAERVIVSQLHRSPGMCSEKVMHPNGTTLFSVRLIPDRGTWIEIQFDTAEQMWVYMDRRRRRRKFLVTTLLRAFGHSTDADILGLFYKKEVLETKKRHADEELAKYVFMAEIRDPETRALIANKYEKVTEPLLKQVAAAGMASVEVVDVSFDDGLLITTLRVDPTASEEDALRDIHHRLRPGDPATSSNARTLIRRLFFDPKRYDLGRVGRYKINQKLGLHGKVDPDLRVLSESGIEVIEAVKHLLAIKTNRASVDDIDHLGNRRIRTAGELLENQCRIGLARTERLIRDRITLQETSQGAASPQRLVNSKTLSVVIADFFGRSQLSQFMDQTNPLSGLAHKRRLSALGPGGLSRDRAGFEVRDVHASHYGRICPIETPEGPNIGLISSLSIYARLNAFGFIQSPYRKVVNGRVSDKTDYLSADEEERYVIAQANAPLDARGTFVNPTVLARYEQEFVRVPRDRVQYMDVSPMQLVSIAAGLIPFLEHDDANRALMGANMMRQAVPLLRTERPFVATGLERRAALDSRVVVMAEKEGIVASVDACSIVVTPDGKVPAKGKKESDEAQVYALQKFRRTNAGTCFNQKAIVKVGQKVMPGDVMADGPATDTGELALGKNLVCAFMPWNGFNFEDAILISQRCVREDVFTSVHITDFECTARETKLGPEEITRDIPNLGEDALRNLGLDGVIRVGAEVKPGDILVGKITPKSETELAPEERLLRAIFGEKAADVRDTSLTVPSGTYGIVMHVKVEAEQKDTRRGGGGASALHAAPVPQQRSAKDIDSDLAKNRKKLKDDLTMAFSNVFLGEKIPLDIKDSETGDVLVPANRKITKAFLVKLADAYERIEIESSPVKEKIDIIIEEFKPRFRDIVAKAEREKELLATTGGEFHGIVKNVRVYIAEKKNLSIGDKLAGRHGNKGVVARIMPDCDMPFLPNGQPVDIVLNPLGVPSRMNIGQVFETHLGAACRALGLYAETPVFDGIKEEEVMHFLDEASTKPDFEWMSPGRGKKADGKTVLFDGRTGEAFDQRVVVGTIYMLKLHHLVTDKMHARATGPYSLVTQQPLGGKAQYGGQRMGEMEVWALEAYGVAYALQELLTVKSDDVAGRTRIYESIVKGTNILQAGMPESFAVLMNELRGLCLNMQLKKDGKVSEITFH